MKRILLALFFLLGAVAVLIAYNWLRDNKMSNFYGKADLYVTESTTPDDVVKSLKSQLKILSERRLRKVFEEKEVSRYIKPGYYRVGSSNTSVYVARMLNNGWQSPVNFTLAGSLRTREEIARKISRQLRVD